MPAIFRIICSEPAAPNILELAADASFLISVYCLISLFTWRRSSRSTHAAARLAPDRCLLRFTSHRSIIDSVRLIFLLHELRLVSSICGMPIPPEELWKKLHDFEKDLSFLTCEAAIESRLE